MAKAKQTESHEAGTIESRTTVTLNSKHDGSPNLYDILVSGRRVGYIIDEATFTITPLPPDSVGVKLIAAEWKAVGKVAREVVQKEAVANRSQAEELDRFFAGE